MLILSGVFDPKSPLFGSVFWRGSKKYPVLALTFDDGPSEPYTSEILEILRKYQIPATFFVLGKKIELYPQAIKKIAAAGQEIGNHGYSHQLLPLKSPGKVVKEIRRTEELVFSATGQRPRLFRAPHGFKSPWLVRAVRKAGYRPVAWTCGVWDTDRPGEKTIIQRSLKGFQNGAILLFHDGRGLEAKPDCSQLVKALPAIIEEALGQGYKFMTVSELMAVGRDTIKKVDAVTN
ncbi:MAG: polysaccharide deacetylase family protein [Candidatus Saccharicenans sp.]|nr:polysaccharide deacetylase family protein [Candidatus Saccharicenans sp.]